MAVPAACGARGRGAHVSPSGGRGTENPVPRQVTSPARLTRRRRPLVQRPPGSTDVEIRHARMKGRLRESAAQVAPEVWLHGEHFPICEPEKLPHRRKQQCIKAVERVVMKAWKRGKVIKRNRVNRKKKTNKLTSLKQECEKCTLNQKQ